MKHANEVFLNSSAKLDNLLATVNGTTWVTGKNVQIISAYCYIVSETEVKKWSDKEASCLSKRDPETST